MNSTVEISSSLQKKLNEPKSVTLLNRRFSGYQLKVSREENGRLRGWVTSMETREVKLKGLPTYLTRQCATQLLKQSYFKFQKEAIEVIPRGLDRMKREHVDSSSILKSGKTETLEQEALQTLKSSVSEIDSLVEAISDKRERALIRETAKRLLEKDPKETALGLQYEQIGALGIQALGTALQVNHTLQFLDFSYNQIDDTGARAIGVVLQVNQSIQELNIEHNQIGEKGAQAIGTALQVNQTLQWLNFRLNRIGTTGAQVLADALQINQSLQWLDLSQNQIDGEGVQALAAALKVNHTLQLLNLAWNQIGTTGIQALETALQVNYTLQFLYFWNNQIGDAERIASKRIDALLEENKKIAIIFRQQIIQIPTFLQSHENDEGILLQNLPQLKELLQKWHIDSKNLISALQEIPQKSEETDLNDRYREKLKWIITDLTNRLHNPWLKPFERKVAALSNEYVMGKESSEERNVNLGYALYETWLTFLGSDCPNWVEDHLQSFFLFGVLLDIAEGGRKKDVTDLTDVHSLFERVLSFRNESKDSLFGLTNQSPKS